MKFLVATGALFLSMTAMAGTTTYNIKGMHCGACAKSIEEKVCTQPGVTECKAQLTKGKKNMGSLTLTTADESTLTADKISELVGEAGDYTVVKTPAGKAKKN